MCQRKGVVGEVNAVRRALLAGHVRRGRSGDQIDAPLLAADLLNGEPGRRGSAVGERIDALAVDPFARQRTGHIRLVLVVALQHLDWPIEHRAAEIGDCQLYRKAIAGTADIAIRATHVAEQADAHRFRCALRADDAGYGQGSSCQRADHGATSDFLHDVPITNCHARSAATNTKPGLLVAALSPSWPGLSRPSIVALCRYGWPGQARP